MKKENIIEKLKTLAENIQLIKQGKRDRNELIYSVVLTDEYLEWRTESEDLLAKYFDNANAQYVEFISVPRNIVGETLLYHFTRQYPIFKLLIKKIERGEIMELNKYEKSPEPIEGKSIFISHAIKDKEIVDAFVDIILHGALSVPIDKIFCVSTDGTKIESGSVWRDSIKESLLSSKINFLIITPNYKESEVCLNEMGAAWVTSAIVIPLIVDPIKYETVGIIQEPNQIEKLLDEKSLDRIKDYVQEKLQIPAALIKSDRWTVKKKEFLIRIKKYLGANPFEVPMDRATYIKLIEERTDLENTINNLIEEKAELEDLIGELKKAKDRTEVAVIIKNRNPSTKFQEFIELCDVVKKRLRENPSIINGIIFRSYSGKKVTIRGEGNYREIDEAFASDFIDDEYNVRWEETSEMLRIKNALDNVERFLSKTLKNDFYQSYEENFDAPLNLSNKLFWEEVFEASISFS